MTSLFRHCPVLIVNLYNKAIRNSSMLMLFLVLEPYWPVGRSQRFKKFISSFRVEGWRSEERGSMFLQNAAINRRVNKAPEPTISSSPSSRPRKPKISRNSSVLLHTLLVFRWYLSLSFVQHVTFPFLPNSLKKALKSVPTDFQAFTEVSFPLNCVRTVNGNHFAYFRSYFVGHHGC
jgi:hypothetical protein